MKLPQRQSALESTSFGEVIRKRGAISAHARDRVVAASVDICLARISQNLEMQVILRDQKNLTSVDPMAVRNVAVGASNLFPSAQRRLGSGGFPGVKVSMYIRGEQSADVAIHMMPTIRSQWHANTAVAHTLPLTFVV